MAVGSTVFDRTVRDTTENLERGLFQLGIGNAQHQVIYDAIEKWDRVRAECMMREDSYPMIEFIQTLEKRDKSQTVADLVANWSIDAFPSVN